MDVFFRLGPFWFYESIWCFGANLSSILLDKAICTGKISYVTHYPYFVPGLGLTRDALVCA